MGWIVRWPSCSAQPSPRSTRSRPGCRARWYSGHSASQSPAIRGRAAWTFRGRALPYLWENCTSGDPLPEHPPGRAVAYTPFYRRQLRDTRAASKACRTICCSRAAPRRPMPRPASTRGAISGLPRRSGEGARAMKRAFPVTVVALVSNCEDIDGAAWWCLMCGCSRSPADPHLLAVTPHAQVGR